MIHNSDKSGRELAIYSVHEGDDTLRTVNLFGNGAMGRVNVNWSPKEVEDKETGEPMWITVRLDDPVYYVKDHLGSIKATLNTSGSTVFAQNTYPYGEIVPGQSYEQSGSGQQRYDFIPWGLSAGKERDVESGLNYFGARYYDSELIRWLSVDAMADKYAGWSPYNYCLANPLTTIDINGDSAWAVKRQWDEKDVEAYAEFAKRKLKEAYDSETPINCADLQYQVLVEYASANGLELVLKSSDGKQEYNSSSEKYSSPEEYMKDAKKLNAIDIKANAFVLNKSEKQCGDMVVLTKPADHVVAYSSIKPPQLIYGNLNSRNQAVKPCKTDYDWTNCNQDGNKRPMKYYPEKGKVLRWSVLKQK